MNEIHNSPARRFLSKNNIFFFYPSGPQLTGQELASLRILEVLKHEVGLRFNAVKLATFDRRHMWSIVHWFQFVASATYVCHQMLMSGMNHKAILYLNLGQGMKSLLLEGVPFCFTGMIDSRRRSVISLHGHFFMEWSAESIRGKLFLWILAHSTYVTVLGLSQKEKLIKWGISKEKVLIVNNTSEEVIESLSAGNISSNRINLLYLGNLIAAKGYKEYLFALLLLSKMDLHTEVNAVICGQLIKTGLDKREHFLNPATWINKMIAKINESLHVRVCWIPGAYGAEKAKVLYQADILVFSSKTEAQPIVIIEAMAAGCAIVASSVGEIPSMLADGAGECLEHCSPENLARTLLSLVNNPKVLPAKQRAARMRYDSHFSCTVYADTWRGIFRNLRQGKS